MWKLKFVSSFALLFALAADGMAAGAVVGAVLGIALLLTEPSTEDGSMNNRSRGFNAIRSRRWRGPWAPEPQ
jgi:hypothetical protein